MTPSYLFIYGTLLQPGNIFADYLNSNSRFHSRGCFAGLLYDIGNYPGALHSPLSELKVHGSIVVMASPDQVLEKLDPYEGIGPDQPKPHLYTRQLLPIETDVETLECWVYIYNLPVTGFTLIAHGDYLQYKKSP